MKFDELLEQEVKQLDELAIGAGLAIGATVGVVRAAKKAIERNTDPKKKREQKKEDSAFWDEQMKKSKAKWDEKIKNAKDAETKAKYKKRYDEIMKRYKDMKKRGSGGLKNVSNMKDMNAIKKLEKQKD